MGLVVIYQDHHSSVHLTRPAFSLASIPPSVAATLHHCCRPQRLQTTAAIPIHGDRHLLRDLCFGAFFEKRHWPCQGRVATLPKKRSDECLRRCASRSHPGCAAHRAAWCWVAWPLEH